MGHRTVPPIIQSTPLNGALKRLLCPSSMLYPTIGRIDLIPPLASVSAVKSLSSMFNTRSTSFDFGPVMAAYTQEVGAK